MYTHTYIYKHVSPLNLLIKIDVLAYCFIFLGTESTQVQEGKGSGLET